MKTKEDLLKGISEIGIKYKGLEGTIKHYTDSSRINNFLDNFAENFQNKKYRECILCISEIIKWYQENLLDIENDSHVYNYSDHVNALEEYKKFENILKEILEYEKIFKTPKNDDEKLKMLLKEKKDIEIQINNILEKKTPLIGLALSLSFIIVGLVFSFSNSFFEPQWLTYVVCGLMTLFGIASLIKDLRMRKDNNKATFESLRLNFKNSLLIMTYGIIVIIPMTIMSFFFMGSLFFRILLFFQIWSGLALFINGISIIVCIIIKNWKKEDKKKYYYKNIWKIIWQILIGVITIVGFVLQIIQLTE
ncbi:MAG: hypothetical protein PHS54_04335 [Clostridia bacterium]|nr:hypothetical protein [Clostridia bacterium]